MPVLRTAFEQLVTWLLRSHQYESRFLRSYFSRTYGIEVGLYTFGCFDRWRIPPGTKIGRYCSIAASARVLEANHPLDRLSTHPFFYEQPLDMAEKEGAAFLPVVIEDDVWMGINSIVAPGCKRIGRGAVIGAGAVVTHDVPAYAIMGGVPAKLIRFRFLPETVEAIEATRWWLLDKSALRTQLGTEFMASPQLNRPTLHEISRAS
jgi:virginiamycin A acetyltransferase